MKLIGEGYVDVYVQLNEKKLGTYIADAVGGIEREYNKRNNRTDLVGFLDQVIPSISNGNDRFFVIVVKVYEPEGETS